MSQRKSFHVATVLAAAALSFSTLGHAADTQEDVSAADTLKATSTSTERKFGITRGLDRPHASYSAINGAPARKAAEEAAAPGRTQVATAGETVIPPLQANAYPRKFGITRGLGRPYASQG